MAILVMVGASIARSQSESCIPDGAEFQEIYSAVELAALAPSGKYRLASDLNLFGDDWLPIDFAGTLDGNGYSLYYLTNASDGDLPWIGLFANLGDGARICNLTFRDPFITDGGVDNRLGVLAGSVASGAGVSITNVHVAGTIAIAGAVTGGILGGVSDGASVDLTDVSVALTSTMEGAEFVGGLVGKNEGTLVIERGTVIGSILGQSRAGGFIGTSDGSLMILDSLALVDVSSVDGRAGGFVAEALGESLTIQRSRHEGSVAVEADGGIFAGGFIGDLRIPGLIEASVHKGSVAASGGNIGGFVGYRAPNPAEVTERLEIRDSYAITSLNGNFAGGMVGRAADVDLYRVYSITTIVGGSTAVGGLIGIDMNWTISGTNIFWDGERGPIDDEAFGENGLNTETIRDPSTYADVWGIVDGWQTFNPDEGAVWGICDDVQSGDPYLLWMFDEAPCGPTVAAAEPGVEDASQVRNVPFDVTLRLLDRVGDTYTARAAGTVVVTASGGATEGALRRADALSDESAITVAIPQGATEVTLEGVIYTGYSASEGGDVTLSAQVSIGDVTTAAATGTLSVWNVVSTVAPSADAVRANGEDEVTITVTLVSATDLPTDTPVIGETISFSTNLGEFIVSGEPVGDTVTVPTDDTGTAVATLRAGRQTGTATVNVTCPVDCASAVVQVIETFDEPLVIPGSEKAWLYLPTLPAGTMAASYRFASASTWTTIDLANPGRPILLTGLMNGESNELFVRLDLADEGDLAFQSISFTPNQVLPPSLEAEPTAGVSEPIQAEQVEGVDRITLPVRVTNTTTEALQTTWLFLTPPQGMNIVSVEPPQGVVQEDGEAWFWRDANLAPGEAAVITVVLEVMGEEEGD